MSLSTKRLCLLFPLSYSLHFLSLSPMKISLHFYCLTRRYVHNPPILERWRAFKLDSNRDIVTRPQQKAFRTDENCLALIMRHICHNHIYSYIYIHFFFTLEIFPIQSNDTWIFCLVNFFGYQFLFFFFFYFYCGYLIF